MIAFISDPEIELVDSALALDALAPLFTPKRVLLEDRVSLKFLTLGLMGCTKAASGPFDKAEQLL